MLESFIVLNIPLAKVSVISEEWSSYLYQFEPDATPCLTGDLWAGFDKLIY
jgi:hypothetical protein